MYPVFQELFHQEFTMKAERSYPKFIITEKGTRWTDTGHPWIYEGEVISGDESVENGAIVDAVSEKGK